MSEYTPTPAMIAERLEERLIGQSEAVREMSIALSKKLAGLGTGNVLMIGASGTGKTTLMRAVESYLASEPRLAGRATLLRIHANVLGAEAEAGRPGEALLGRLLVRARELAGEDASAEELLRRARHGVVFVDEIDKIRSRIGDTAHLAGIRAQEALLTLIENEAVALDLPDWLGGGRVTVDASQVLFVAAGAFEGLYDAVYDRVTLGKDRGALKTVTVVSGGEMRQALEFNLREWLTNEDLFAYGMTPQFLSRFGSRVILDDLDEEALVRIFLETPDSGYRASCDYFESHGLHLALSPAAVRRIAAEAAAQPRLGARALESVFRRVIGGYEYDPQRGAESGSLMIDLPEVEAALARS